MAKVPFISTHVYPLDILEKSLGIERHPFYDESKKCTGRPDLFVNFVKEFMKNFEANYKLCILWTDKCHNLLMNRINSENSLLDIMIGGFKKSKSETKKLI